MVFAYEKQQMYHLVGFEYYTTFVWLGQMSNHQITELASEAVRFLYFIFKKTSLIQTSERQNQIVSFTHFMQPTAAATLNKTKTFRVNIFVTH